MLPHPILASEDDEEYVSRSISFLPKMIDLFFESLEKVYIEGKDEEYITRANTAYLMIRRQLLVLNSVPSSSFRTLSTDDSGRLGYDDELPKLLDRLSRLFLDDVITVGPQSLPWKKPSQQLAADCAEHIQNGKLKFPLLNRLQRNLVTYRSSLFVVAMIIYGLITLFVTVAVIVLPAVRPAAAVGAPIGAVAGFLCVVNSLIMIGHFIIATKSLHVLYSRLFQQALIFSSSAELVPIGSYIADKDASGNKNMRDFVGVGAATVKHNNAHETSLTTVDRRKGFFTIPYDSTTGYIDGKVLDSQIVMIAYDKDFNITRWNNAAEVMTGFLEDGCIGKHIDELILPGEGSVSVSNELKQAKKNNLIKIKLQSLATAPTTLYTCVAPIMDSSGNRIGNILVCANTKDILRVYKAYIHNYLVRESILCLDTLRRRGSLCAADATLVQRTLKFIGNCYINHVEGLAREMLSGWEWTNVEQFLGQALGVGLSSHEVVVDPSFPTTICISPLASKALAMVVSLAGRKCTINLKIITSKQNISILEIVTRTGGATPNPEKLQDAIDSLLESSGGNIINDGMSVTLHFPTQVSVLIDDDVAATTTDGTQQLAQARNQVTCVVNVLSAVSSLVDQHNLTLFLLRTMFVSLASVRDRQDLEERLTADPCEIDVVICDNTWLPECRRIQKSEDCKGSFIIVPLIDADAKLPPEFKYSIRLPMVGKDIQEMMVTVGKSVSMNKDAVAARQERERILTLRQDSPWTKGKLLGRGSYGAVYEATSDLTGGRMAVKMFYFTSDNEKTINQLLNEIKIMCSLNNTNIVHYFHCERTNNNVSLFMELCDASLMDIIIDRTRKPPKLTVIHIIQQVISAIGYLHNRGIVHRDIKPQNIMLKGDIIKLTDFGTARQGDAMKEVKGTFRYMAPEVYKGEPHSLPCDIWSVGCLACELFLCVPKFMEHASILGELTTTATPYLDDVPANPVLRDFVFKCFKMNPAERPTAQELLSHPLLSTSAFSADIERLPNVFTAPPRSQNQSAHQAFSLDSDDSD